jgi:hypothetical protein
MGLGPKETKEMTATWRTKVQFELSQAEAERLHDLIVTLRDPSGKLTDNELEYVATFLRLLRNPADLANMSVVNTACFPERMPF